MKIISVQELKGLINSDESLSLVDIRENYEFEDGHIENSINIPMDDVAQNPSQIQKNTVLICRSGRRAESLSYILQKNHNRTDISFLAGGILAFNEN